MTLRRLLSLLMVVGVAAAAAAIFSPDTAERVLPGSGSTSRQWRAAIPIAVITKLGLADGDSAPPLREVPAAKPIGPIVPIVVSPVQRGPMPVRIDAIFERSGPTRPPWDKMVWQAEHATFLPKKTSRPRSMKCSSPTSPWPSN